jgi:Fe-only nitrogenase accessory protein AnfO
MKIATHINESGEVANFCEEGSVCLYENISGVWTKRKEIFFTMKDITSLSDVRYKFLNVVFQLNDCRIFLIRELKGLQRALLEEMGFHTWKSEGGLIEQLDFVAGKENETIITNQNTCSRAAVGHQDSYRCGADCSSSRKEATGLRKIGSLDINKPIPAPLPVGDISSGYYRTNLAEVLKNNPDLTSRQVLIPFMETTAFQKLEIFCDHLPRWLSREAELLNLSIESDIPDTSGHGIKVTIIPIN